MEEEKVQTVVLPTYEDKEADIIKKGDIILVDEQTYIIEEDYKNALEDMEAFSKRYTKILQKYDYIVGDWGHEQLRLKGFYKNDRKQALDSQKIETLEDYLYEFCSFGCAYFVLRLDGDPLGFEDEDNFDKKGNRRKRRPYYNQRQKKHVPAKPVVKTSKHQFTMKKSKEGQNV